MDSLLCNVATSLPVMEAGRAGKCMCVCANMSALLKQMQISYSQALSWSKKRGGMLIESDGSLSGDIMRPSYMS